MAIKILPDTFAADADPSAGSGSPRAASRGDRLLRFEQEARAAAALNHPSIAVVHDVGVEGTTRITWCRSTWPALRCARW